MYKKLKEFISIVNRANLRKENDIRLSINDANEIVSDLTKLLLEKEEVANNKGSIVIDGGDFANRMEESKIRRKRKGTIYPLVVLLAGISFVVNSYTREIQTTIHKGIGWVWDKVHPDAGEFVYDVNGIIFNGKGFDGERDVKHTINETFQVL